MNEKLEQAASTPAVWRINRTVFVVLAGCLALTVGGCSTPQADFETNVNETLAFAAARFRATADAIPDTTLFPRSAGNDRTWHLVEKDDWTSGFFPGCLWLIYEATNDPYFFHEATRRTNVLEPAAGNSDTTGIGCIFGPSFGSAFRTTGDERYRTILLAVADSCATRWNPVVGAISTCSSNGDTLAWPVTIETMVEIELLFTAAKNGGAPELRTIAEAHARTIMLNHVRPDGSTFQVVDYKPDTGAIRGTYSILGYSRDSTWARGQALALYGFTVAYRETKDPAFLDTARKLAAYFIDNLPSDHIPYWDFDAPGIPDEPRDSSAAAIAASALLELSTQVTDRNDGVRFFGAAVAIIDALISPVYLSKGTGSPGLLRHACGDVPEGTEVDVSLIYGDYYFLEALVRYKLGVGE
jgi:unsaturated chondroitin disaccharide hydrolase